MKRLFLRVIIISFLISCHQSSHENLHQIDKWSDWLLKNESYMNSELNKKMVFVMQDIPKNAIYKSSTIVITKDDTTILGEFARLISDYNSCLLVSYTFIGDTTKRKVISLVRNNSMTCIVNTDSILTIDSTSCFIIKKISQSSVTH